MLMEAGAARTVVVTGAASQIGYFLIPRLAAAGLRVVAVSRRPEPEATAQFGRHWAGAGVARWVQADLEAPAVSAWATGATAWVHLGPMALVPQRIAAFAAAGGATVIAFGSTSRFTKAGSASEKEQRTVAALVAGEAAIEQACVKHGICWAVFRPTLIYGCGLDRNVMVIAAAIRRFGFFPLLGEARGLRQPVHADDLAQACVAAVQARHGLNRAFDLSGGEVLSYREMVLRVFEAAGRTPRLMQMPVAVIGFALWCLSRVPRYRDFNVQMARRMGQDMVFAHDAAAAALGYAPRQFTPVVDPPPA
jgi:nucleoside-diphosphate-sugar epimerase